MIRFIDLRGQSTGYRFAFWCTVQDRFLPFAGEQAWDTKADFMDSFEDATSGHRTGQPRTIQPLLRFLSLMPPWTNEPADDADNQTSDQKGQRP